MAREMALAGVDKSELAPPPPPKMPKTFREKCENFWYHYKWITLVVLALLLIAGWFVYQQITANPADYEVVVVTEQPLYPQETEALCAYLAEAGEDLDGDGTVEVTIENLNPCFYDELAPNIGKSDVQKLMSYLTTGDRMLFVFDRVSFDGFTETVTAVTSEGYCFFMPLSVSSSEYDADAHYWSWRGDARTDDEAFAQMPEEMLFGVRDATGTASGAQKRSAEGAALLERLISSVSP